MIYVFSHSTAFVCFGGGRSHCDLLLPFFQSFLINQFLVSQIQEINQRHHEHPNQIDEVPIESGDFEVVRVVAAALVAQADGDESDHAAGDVQQVQAGDAEEQRAE